MTGDTAWAATRAIGAVLLLAGCAVFALPDPPLDQPRPTLGDLVAAMDAHLQEETLEFVSCGILSWAEVPWKSDRAELRGWAVHHKAPGAADVTHGWVCYVDVGESDPGQWHRRQVERTYLLVFRDGVLQSVVDVEPGTRSR